MGSFITRLLIISLSLFALTSCAFVALSFESVRRSGLTADSRKQLLPEFLSGFVEAITVTDATRALAYASEDFKPELRNRLIKNRGKIKVIDNEIVLSEFSDDARRAEITVQHKFYRIPVYIAEEKLEKQIWIYDGAGVWLIDGIEVVDENS
jgi:hypothetical protein